MGGAIKKLFFDDSFLRENRMQREFHFPEKCGSNPVIVPDRPWEGQAAFVDTGIVIRDEASGKFRCWYQAGLCGDAGDGSCMCYAESDDGIFWWKPDLGLVPFRGSTENNIVLMENVMMHDPAVLIDESDPDPSRRYKCVWWGGEPGIPPAEAAQGHCVAFSPDGIRWTPHQGNPIWRADPEIANPIGIRHAGDKYRFTCSVGGQGMRVVGITSSMDFETFDKPKILFMSGRDDPFGIEFSGLSLVEYAGIYVGMLWVVRRPVVRSREEWEDIVRRGREAGRFVPPIGLNSGRAGKWSIYTELVYGPDLDHLARPLKGRPYIPMGEAGSWDECIILANRLAVVDGKIMIYYVGQGRQENLPGESFPVKEWPQATGLCTLREDGFVSLGGRGAFTTMPFVITGEIHVNTDASHGEVIAQLIDDHGDVLPDFTYDRSAPIRKDALDVQLSWKDGDIRKVIGKKAMLQMSVRDAKVYSISWIDGGRKV